MTSVHQCPHCPVRFSHRTEVDWHLRDEHDEVHLEYVARSAPADAHAGLVPHPRSHLETREPVRP